MDIAIPKTVKQVRTFLGLCNAFQDYIPGFALMQKTFSKLVSKDCKFNWTNEHNQQFNKTKEAIRNVTGRFHVTYKDPLILQVDASDNGVGGVLLQVPPNSAPQPIIFLSHAFSDVAQRWSTIEQEAYAILLNVKIFY